MGGEAWTVLLAIAIVAATGALTVFGIVVSIVWCERREMRERFARARERSAGGDVAAVPDGLRRVARKPGEEATKPPARRGSHVISHHDSGAHTA